MHQEAHTFSTIYIKKKKKERDIWKILEFFDSLKPKCVHIPTLMNGTFPVLCRERVNQQHTGSDTEKV